MIIGRLETSAHVWVTDLETECRVPIQYTSQYQVFNMYPGKTYRLTLKKGMAGHDVWALQKNLNLLLRNQIAEDGDFGSFTEQQVIAYQRNHELKPDGIAGLLTQRSLALRLQIPVTREFALPPGLFQGLIEGESGWAVGCVSWNNVDTNAESVDCCWVQDNVLRSEYSEARFAQAFDGPWGFKDTGKKLRDRKTYADLKNPGLTNERAWRYGAILYHNWPAASERIVAGTFDSWKYTSNYYFNKPGVDNGTFVSAIFDNGNRVGEVRRYSVDTDAQWVSRWGIPNVTTGRDWAIYYVDTKTAYVTGWPD